jgi:nucleoside-diphosphate-sugar epimerase
MMIGASPLATAAKTELPAWAYHDHYCRPAVMGTIKILKAAHKAGTVQRIVVTSSLAAILSMEEMRGLRGPIKRIVSEDERVPAPQLPYKDEFVAYAASKIEALAAAEEWMEKRRCQNDQPTFDLVHLHPGFVLGRNPAARKAHKSLHGGNSMIMAILRGFPLGTNPGATVHVDDVALAHVRALDRNLIEGNKSYILNAGAKWEQTVDIVDKKFPGAFPASDVPVRDRITTLKVNAGTWNTESKFKFEYKTFEEQVESAMGQYLELQHEQERKLQRKREEKEEKERKEREEKKREEREEKEREEREEREREEREERERAAAERERERQEKEKEEEEKYRMGGCAMIRDIGEVHWSCGDRRSRDDIIQAAYEKALAEAATAKATAKVRSMVIEPGTY